MTKPLKITLISLASLIGLLILVFLYFFFVVHIMVRHLFKPGDKQMEYIIPARRGRILAADGRTLVESERRYDIYMDCSVVKDENKWAEESRALAQEIAHFLPTRSAPEWWHYFQNARQVRNKFITIVQGIDLGV